MKKGFVFLVVFLACFRVLAQTNIVQALKTMDEKYPQEKIHLFLNKEAFTGGETIKFKAYLFTGVVQSNISKTLYVELLNEQKQPVSQQLIPLFNSVGEGAITIPASLPEGNYYLTAYTKWMLNFNELPRYFYHLPVYNSMCVQKLIEKPVAWTARLYPESGILLSGQNNKIAIRLTAQGSLPKSWQGYITEEGDSGKRLLSFTSLNRQIAVFNFQPQNGKAYIAHVFDSLGNQAKIAFKSSVQGALLKARQQGRLLDVELRFQGTKNGGYNYQFVAASYGQLLYSTTIKKTDTLIRIAIPIEKLLSGIVQLTLFDIYQRPVAERLVFLQTDPLVNVTITPLSNGLEGATEWNIEGDSSLPESYAIAIADASSATSRNRSLKSDLWLGDLSDDILEPQQYFRGDSVHITALDALLVTERWRSYQWKQILADSFPLITYQPEGYLSFKAKATENGQPIKEEKLNLLFKFKDSSLHLSQVTTDKKGEFFIQDATIFDSAFVYNVNAQKTKKRNIRFQWQGLNQFMAYHGVLPFSFQDLQLKSSPNSRQSSNEKTANARNSQPIASKKNDMLQEVTVKTSAKTPTQLLAEKLSSPLFQTDNEVMIDFVNEEQNATSYNNVFDWLEGRVAGLNFTILEEERQDPITLATIPAGLRIPIMRDGQPVIFVDEMLTDVTQVHSLSVSDIAMIKVIKGYFLGAPSGGGGHGAIAIYTKKAGLVSNEKKDDSPAGVLVGYFRETDRQQLNWYNLPFQHGKATVKIGLSEGDVKSGLRFIITGFTRDARPIYYENVLYTNH